MQIYCELLKFKLLEIEMIYSHINRSMAGFKAPLKDPKRVCQNLEFGFQQH